MTRRVLSAAFALFLVLTAGRARADVRAVLVISGGTAFRDALSVSLSPWDLKVIPLDIAPPRPIMPRAADDARALVQQHGASGLVWVAMDQSEPSLWVYDAATDQVVTRKITTPPPFDAPTAAAAALTVKTLLRSSTVAPPEERIGAVPPSPKAAPPPPVDVVGAAAQPPESRGPSALPSAESMLRAEIEGAGRAIAGTIDTRASVGGSVWLGAGRLGLALAGSFGPGLSVNAPRFSGRFEELALAPSVRLRIPIARRFVLEPRLGTSLHATSIDGVAVVAARTASTSRLDGALDAALALELVGTRSIGLALDVGASVLLRYQRYLVGSDAIFELYPLQAFVGLRLTTGIL